MRLLMTCRLSQERRVKKSSADQQRNVQAPVSTMAPEERSSTKPQQQPRKQRQQRQAHNKNSDQPGSARLHQHIQNNIGSAESAEPQSSHVKLAAEQHVEQQHAEQQQPAPVPPAVVIQPPADWLNTGTNSGTNWQHAGPMQWTDGAAVAGGGYYTPPEGLSGARWGTAGANVITNEGASNGHALLPTNAAPAEASGVDKEEAKWAGEVERWVQNVAALTSPEHQSQSWIGGSGIQHQWHQSASVSDALDSSNMQPLHGYPPAAHLPPHQKQQSWKHHSPQASWPDPMSQFGANSSSANLQGGDQNTWGQSQYWEPTQQYYGPPLHLACNNMPLNSHSNPDIKQEQNIKQTWQGSWQ